MNIRASLSAALGSAALAVSILAVSAATAGAQANPGTFTFQPIVSPADPAFTQLLGINDQMLIAGYHTNTPGNKGLTLGLGDGTFTDENSPNSAQTQVVGINNNGDTVGFFIDQAGNTHGFSRLGGKFATVDQPGTPFNQLLGINGSGQIVGYSQDSNGIQHNYIYTNKRQKNFNSLNVGMPSSQATGINDTGLVVGFEQTSPAATTSSGWIYDSNGGKLTILNYPNALMTQALGVNNKNQVVGTYTDAATATHGFIYSNGGFQSIDVDGATMTTVNGINSAGSIVGFFMDANGNTIGMVGTPNS